MSPGMVPDLVACPDHATGDRRKAADVFAYQKKGRPGAPHIGYPEPGDCSLRSSSCRRRLTDSSIGRATGAPASIPKQPGRAARFTDVGAAGQIGSRTDLPHCTSRHRVDVDRARDWPYLSEPESLLPDRRPPEPLFASAASPEFPLGPVLEA